jgi:hypothetical protein
MRRHFIVLATSIASVAAGCSGATTPAGSSAHYLSAAGAQQEYRVEAARLTLPAGGQFPERAVGLPEQGDDGQTILYERNIGAQKADVFWYCSWARQALSTTGQPRQQAVTKIAGLRDLVFWGDIDSNGVELFSSQIEKAKLGEFSELQRYVDGNCPQ